MEPLPLEKDNKSFGIHYDPLLELRFLLNGIAIDILPGSIIISSCLF